MDKQLLFNQYLIIRHGHSIANEQRIIVSNPETGISQYGLTEKGKIQVKRTAENLTVGKSLIIYSSDFLRTRETTEILSEILKPEEVQYTPLLRERYFGFYDGLDDGQYYEIWKKDLTNENNKINSIESPRQVSDRVESLINFLEKKYSGKTLLLVSHGDCLQIMQTLFENSSPSCHRSLAHLNVAEIREI